MRFTISKWLSLTYRENYFLLCIPHDIVQVKKSTAFFLNLSLFILLAIAFIAAGDPNAAAASFWGFLALILFYLIKNRFSAIVLSGITVYYVGLGIAILIACLVFDDLMPDVMLLIPIILMIISYFNLIVIKKIIRGDESFVTNVELEIDFDLVIDKQTEYLLYLISILVPIAGMLIGATYVTKNEKHLQFVGKKCLRFSLVTTISCSVIIIANLV